MIVIVINFDEDIDRSLLELIVNLKCLELEFELKFLEFELGLKLIWCWWIWIEMWIEKNLIGIGIGIELKKNGIDLTPVRASSRHKTFRLRRRVL